MNKNILKETIELLSEFDLNAKKKFGQNFLIDSNILENIVIKSGVNKSDLVIEVGPGLGNLSKFIAPTVKQLDCYEVDPDMIPVLEKSLSKFGNVNVFLKDIKDVDLTSYGSTPLHLIANLPYYLTSFIIFKFLDSDINLKTMTIMMQKEVAQRIVGKPSTKDYNALSVLIQYRANAELLFNVSKEVFIPKPKVTSSVIKLTMKERTLSREDEDKFIKVTQSSFSMKRKTLVNNLHHEFNLDKEYIISVLESLGLKSTVRAEDLTLEEFILLSKELVF